MARCIDCSWFPWKPGADFSYLPAIRCHPNVKARRWLGDSALSDRECQWYRAREDLPKMAPAGDSRPKQVVEQAVEENTTSSKGMIRRAAKTS